MPPSVRSSVLISTLIAANLLITAFWGCSLIVDGNFIEPEDAGISCTGIMNGERCPGAELEEARLLCLNGECVESVCGDGFIDEEAGEECEEISDACDSRTCRYRCWEDADCDEPVTCMSVSCVEHACVASIAASGTRCATEEIAFGACNGRVECKAISCASDVSCEGETSCESGRCVEGLCEPRLGAACTLSDETLGICGSGLKCEPAPR